MDCRVIFEDENLIAVDKPAGRPVIAGRGDIGEPVNAELERRIGKKIFVVHRLDLEASGVVVFAKTAEAHRGLCAQFEARRAQKTYLAAVLGRAPESGEIAASLREFGSGRIGVDPGGTPALTRYRALERGTKSSLLEVDLITGRRHQIRVHLYHIGHPILGDTRYGVERPVAGAPRLLLHALELRLFEPVLALRAEIPANFFWTYP